MTALTLVRGSKLTPLMKKLKPIVEPFLAHLSACLDTAKVSGHTARSASAFAVSAEPFTAKVKGQDGNANWLEIMQRVLHIRIKLCRWLCESNPHQDHLDETGYVVLGALGFQVPPPQPALLTEQVATDYGKYGFTPLNEEYYQKACNKATGDSERSQDASHGTVQYFDLPTNGSAGLVTFSAVQNSLWLHGFSGKSMTAGAFRVMMQVTGNCPPEKQDALLEAVHKGPAPALMERHKGDGPYLAFLQEMALFL
jgi:hypothetical protein